MKIRWPVSAALCIGAALLASTCASAQADAEGAGGYRYKSLADFRRIDDYPNIEEFESDVRSYLQDCLDHTGGGTGGIPCNITDAIWDRELNIAYQRLLPKLDAAARRELKESQVAWLKARDLTAAFEIHFADAHYPKQGTMFLLMRSGEIHTLAATMARERTLQLRQWYDTLAHPLDD